MALMAAPKLFAVNKREKTHLENECLTFNLKQNLFAICRLYSEGTV